VVHDDGTVSQGADADAYRRAVDGKSRLFAVWPGQWSSDLFAIDDLDVYARAVGLVHDVEQTGLAEHDHQVRWRPSAYESNPQGSYISIDVFLDCGCNHPRSPRFRRPHACSARLGCRGHGWMGSQRRRVHRPGTSQKPHAVTG
jgi:hypothetical protein